MVDVGVQDFIPSMCINLKIWLFYKLFIMLSQRSSGCQIFELGFSCLDHWSAEPTSILYLESWKLYLILQFAKAIL